MQIVMYQIESMQNENYIHPTAIIEADVKLGYGNYIGPYCVVAANTELGNHNHLLAHVNLNSKVEIGSHNVFYSNVSVGQAGEMGAKGDRMAVHGKTQIGDHNTLRENVCVHAPIYYEATIIQNHCYLMNGSYVAHDVWLEDYVNLTSGVKLAGRVKVEAYANLGLNATVHQRCVIGESAMIGMSAVVTKSIPPFAVVAGNPASILKFNAVGAERRGFGADEVGKLQASYSSLFSKNFEASHPILQKIKKFIEEQDKVLTNFKNV